MTTGRAGALVVNGPASRCPGADCSAANQFATRCRGFPIRCRQPYKRQPAAASIPPRPRSLNRLGRRFIATELARWGLTYELAGAKSACSTTPRDSTRRVIN